MLGTDETTRGDKAGNLRGYLTDECCPLRNGQSQFNKENCYSLLVNVK